MLKENNITLEMDKMIRWAVVQPNNSQIRKGKWGHAKRRAK